MTKSIHRFHNSAAARLVCKTAQPLINAELTVEHIPTTDTRQDPPGDWVIVGHVSRDDGWLTTSKLSNAVDQGIQHALAAELRKFDQYNPLLTIWHLRPENAGKIGKYDVYDKS